MNIQSESTEISANAVIFTLTLPNQMAELEKMNAWLGECAETIGLSMRGTFRLQLLLEEIAMNVFENAFNDDHDHAIVIHLIAEEEGLTIQVEDDGRPFDPTLYQERQQPKSLQEAKIGGIGLHLVRNYTDHFEYQRIGDRNVLRLCLIDNDTDE